MYGVTGKTLGSKLGAKVPSEPSYVIFNTAMSSTWGFPEGETGCPKNCDCSCYDCNDPSGKCSCGFADGFCASLPGHFLVEYVRVYQNPNDGLQKIGCSTPERPSSRWIEGHASNYKDELDEVPLRPVSSGGARCKSDEDCGGGGFGDVSVDTAGSELDRGVCARSASHGSRKVCVCHDEFTGPDCKAHAGQDPIMWEKPGFYLGPFPTLFLPPVLPSVVAGLALIFLVTYLGHVSQAKGSGVSACFGRFIARFDDGGDSERYRGSFSSSRTPSRDNIQLITPGRQAAKTYSMLKRPSEVMLNRMVNTE